MKTLTVPTTYGYQELRLLQKRYMTWAFVVAVSIQLIVIGSYHLLGWLKPGESIVINKPPRGNRSIEFIPLPPPLDNRLRNIGIPLAGTKISIGTPIPVPDGEVTPGIEFAGQDIPDAKPNPFGDSGSGDRFVTPPDVENDPSPDIFQATEVDPEILLRHTPDYPVLAQRINLEGIVYVKILVDKRGNVKKAIVLKSDSDLFTQPAIDAAMKWFFKPALMNGKPVAVWVSIPFRFRLTK